MWPVGTTCALVVANIVVDVAIEDETETKTTRNAMASNTFKNSFKYSTKPLRTVLLHCPASEFFIYVEHLSYSADNPSSLTGPRTPMYYVHFIDIHAPFVSVVRRCPDE